MARDNKKPQEVELIWKVVDFITNIHPNEIKKASKEFQKIDNTKLGREAYERELLAWFLLKRNIKGATPMEYAYSFPLDFFTREDKEIIKNFINYIESFFEVAKISKDKKDYEIVDITSNKRYLIKTIDFPDVLQEKGFIRALIVKKGNHYFFYGNVAQYTKKEEKRLKKEILSGYYAHKKRESLEIKWDIEYFK